MEQRPDTTVTEHEQDLVARLMAAQAMGRFYRRAFDVYQSYGVNYKELPEWADQSPLEEARKLKPYAALNRIHAYFEELNNALSAAIRRKAMREAVVIGGKPPKAFVKKDPRK